MKTKTWTTSVRTSYLGLITKLVMLMLFIGVGVAAYQHWGAVVTSVIAWQKELHIMLSGHMKAVSENAFGYGGALIALSFGYGVFHAVGPGHGKAVIVTYLGANKESMRKGIFISFAAALFQSVVAIVLVSLLARVLEFKLTDVHNYGNDVTQVSYVLVMLLGAMLIVTSVRRMFRLRRASKEVNGHGADHQEHSGHKEQMNHSHAHLHSHDHSNEHDHHHSPEHHTHEHGAGCGCSHAHAPTENESVLQTLAVILSMGLRPCSGAIVVLIYAHLVGVYSYGVIATLLMGVGTGLSVSLIAIATLYARSRLERLVNKSGNQTAHFQQLISHYVRFVGGVILTLLGWSFFSTSLMLATGHPLF